MSSALTLRNLRRLQSLPFIFRTVGTRLSMTYVFPLNPESFSLDYPTKGGVIQTMNGNFENWYGMGVPKGNLRGTFGFDLRPQYGLLGVSLPGQLQFKLLETIFSAFYREFQEVVQQNNASWEFYDVTDVHALRIRITNFQYERATSHQFLHRYNIQFVVLEDFLNPDKIIPQNSFLSQLSSPKLIVGAFDAITGNLSPAKPDAATSAIDGISRGQIV